MIDWTQGITSKNEKVSHPLLKDKGVELHVKREDLIHPVISGNKWRKLRYHILEAEKDLSCEGLLTKGGAYSNHILATASAAQSRGMKSKAFIRGECILPLNPTLSRAMELGMECVFVDRSKYRLSIDDLAEWHDIGPTWMRIPEGGTDELGVKGCEEILAEWDKEHYDRIAVSFGTGGTAAGLLGSLGEGQALMVFSALKGVDVSMSLEELMGKERFAEVRDQLMPYEDYHSGGYAKLDKFLISFIRTFEQDTGIPLDPVYTAKMFSGLFDLIKRDRIPNGTRILAIHTGGLQGRKGMEERLGIDFATKA